MLSTWSESGTTWPCAIDTNPANARPDCARPNWSQPNSGAIVATPSASAVIPASRTGVVSLDVSRASAECVHAPLSGTSCSADNLVIEETQFIFGLGQNDAARLYAPTGDAPIESYAWGPS